MEVRCLVTAIDPFTFTLAPDLPHYEECTLVVDYTEALLTDLGPTLLMLYASYAGPPITREALVTLVEPITRTHLARATREEIVAAAREGYPAVLARAHERVDDLA